jgi:hypothetical protein
MFTELLYFSLLSILHFQGIEVPESCSEWNKAGRETVKLITSIFGALVSNSNPPKTHLNLHRAGQIEANLQVWRVFA